MAANVNRGLMGFLRRSWHENPEVVGGCGFGIAGLVILVFSNIRYNSIDGDNRPYKSSYIVYRHDDPCVSTLKKQCDLTSR